MWKRLRQAVTTRRSFFRRYLSILAQDADCDGAIIVHVGRSGQYRASRHPWAAAIIASTPRIMHQKNSPEIKEARKEHEAVGVVPGISHALGLAVADVVARPCRVKGRGRACQ